MVSLSFIISFFRSSLISENFSISLSTSFRLFSTFPFSTISSFRIFSASSPLSFSPAWNLVSMPAMSDSMSFFAFSDSSANSFVTFSKSLDFLSVISSNFTLSFSRTSPISLFNDSTSLSATPILSSILPTKSSNLSLASFPRVSLVFSTFPSLFVSPSPNSFFKEARLLSKSPFAETRSFFTISTFSENSEVKDFNFSSTSPFALSTTPSISSVFSPVTLSTSSLSFPIVLSSSTLKPFRSVSIPPILLSAFSMSSFTLFSISPFALSNFSSIPSAMPSTSPFTPSILSFSISFRRVSEIPENSDISESSCWIFSSTSPFCVTNSFIILSISSLLCISLVSMSFLKVFITLFTPFSMFSVSSTSELTISPNSFDFPFMISSNLSFRSTVKLSISFLREPISSPIPLTLPSRSSVNIPNLSSRFFRKDSENFSDPLSLFKSLLSNSFLREPILLSKSADKEFTIPCRFALISSMEFSTDIIFSIMLSSIFSNFFPMSSTIPFTSF